MKSQARKMTRAEAELIDAMMELYQLCHWGQAETPKGEKAEARLEIAAERVYNERNPSRTAELLKKYPDLEFELNPNK